MKFLKNCELNPAWGLACCVDVETTGLNPNYDEIIELAASLFAYDSSTGNIIGIVDEYEGFQEPQISIQPDAQKVHGITMNMIKGKELDFERLLSILQKAEFLVAHNAVFDKGFITRLIPETSSKTWVCSCKDIDWKKEGLHRRKLSFLLEAHNIIPSQSHRAMADVHNTILLLTQRSKNSHPYFYQIVLKMSNMDNHRNTLIDQKPITKTTPEQTNSMVKGINPEERELERKVNELKQYEHDLVEKETEYETLKLQLNQFEREYLRIIGTRMATLDGIEATILEIKARFATKNKKAKVEASKARERAEESSRIFDDDDIMDETIPRFEPTEDLKKLYRDAAKMMHPDLTTDTEEKERRHIIMIEIIAAYKSGDAEKLQKLIREWQDNPDSVKGEDIGSRIIWFVRKIAQVQNRIDELDEEILSFKSSDLYVLWQRAEDIKSRGGNLLEDIASEYDQKIDDARHELQDIRRTLLMKRMEELKEKLERSQSDDYSSIAREIRKLADILDKEHYDEEE